MLLIISGQSAAGKELVIKKLMTTPLIKKMNFSKIISYADRKPRSGEKHGVDHFFVSPQEMDRLDKSGKLIEVPALYGTSRKATGTDQILEALKGKNKIWRIDSSLCLQIAEGKFFDNLEFFDPQRHKYIIFFLTAPRDQLIKRRKKRDKNRYSPKEYKKRDQQDESAIKRLKNTSAIFIENSDNKSSRTVDIIVSHLKKFLETTKE